MTEIIAPITLMPPVEIIAPITLMPPVEIIAPVGPGLPGPPGVPGPLDIVRPSNQTLAMDPGEIYVLPRGCYLCTIDTVSVFVEYCVEAAWSGYQLRRGLVISDGDNCRIRNGTPVLVENVKLTLLIA